MATVTFEAPDELAAQFNADPSALPKLIREAVQTKLAQTRIAEAERREFAALAGSGDDGVPPLPARRWNRLLLSKSPPRQEERLEEWLDRNGEAELTPEEQAVWRNIFSTGTAWSC